MNISQEKTGNLNAVITINLNPEDYQPRVDKAIKEQAKKAKLPGFRPGMVPPAHVKRMYGKSILVDEINNMLQDTLNNYLNENQMEVLGQPLPAEGAAEKSYNWDFADQFEFNYEVGLAPDFDVDISKNDTLTIYNIKVDDETLAARIKNLRKSYGKMTNPDVSAEDDVLYGELKQLSPDGSVFEDGISNITSVRLDQVTDDEVKASLVGLKKDDVVTFDIQKAYNNDAVRIAALLKIEEAEAADLKLNFQLTVKNINRLEESDLDQTFFDKIVSDGSVTTEEEFRTRITGELEGMMVQDADHKLQGEMLEYVLNKVNFELPDEFLKRWLKATNEKLSDEELSGGYDDFAKNLKWTLIGNKIMQNQDLKIEYEDVLEMAKQRIDAQFRMYSPQAISEDQLNQYAVQFLQNKENANRIFEEAKSLKVFDYLKGQVTLNEQEITANEFNKLAQA